jgi:hypothetical protein
MMGSKDPESESPPGQPLPHVVEACKTSCMVTVCTALEPTETETETTAHKVGVHVTALQPMLANVVPPPPKPPPPKEPERLSEFWPFPEVSRRRMP